MQHTCGGEGKQCPKLKQSSGPAGTNGRAKRKLLRLANSFGKKYTTSVRANTGRDRRSRPLQSGCPRPGVQESNSHLHPRTPKPAPSEAPCMRRAPRSKDGHPRHADPARRRPSYGGKAGQQHRTRLWRVRPERWREGEVQRRGGPRRGRRSGRRVPRSVVSPERGPRKHAGDARTRADRRTRHLVLAAEPNPGPFRSSSPGFGRSDDRHFVATIYHLARGAR